MYLSHSGIGLLIAMLGLGAEAGMTKGTIDCGGVAEDSDGDGLNRCVEDDLGTADDQLDSDGDGVPDFFEYHHGMNAALEDGDADLDGDGLSNFEEFLTDSAPDNPNSPAVLYAVAPDGEDHPAGGTLQAPWRSINFAISQIPAGPARLLLAPGDYVEDVALRAGVTLAGDRGGDVRILGAMSGAPGAALEHLTLATDFGSTALLTLDDVAMHLLSVRFEGDVSRTSLGLVLHGAAPALGTLEGCTFTRLGIGIEVHGAAPRVRRCVFDDIPAAFGEPAQSGAGIIFRASGSGIPTESIGEEQDPGEGWNDFLDTIEGFAAINERDEAVGMQSNYWGTTDPAEFPNRVRGNAVVLPVLAQSSAVLASSLFCTVWDSRDQSRVATASMALTVSTFDEVSGNESGIYAFPAVGDGAYSLRISAPGFENEVVPLELGAGELKSLAVALRPSAQGAGGGNVAKGCPMPEGSEEARASQAGGDVMLLVLMFAALALSRPNRRAGRA